MSAVPKADRKTNGGRNQSKKKECVVYLHLLWEMVGGKRCHLWGKLGLFSQILSVRPCMLCVGLCFLSTHWGGSAPTAAANIKDHVSGKQMTPYTHSVNNRFPNSWVCSGKPPHPLPPDAIVEDRLSVTPLFAFQTNPSSSSHMDLVEPRHRLLRRFLFA